MDTLVVESACRLDHLTKTRRKPAIFRPSSGHAVVLSLSGDGSDKRLFTDDFVSFDSYG